MIIKKVNMPAFDVLKKDWHDYVEMNEKATFDPCLIVGFMACGLSSNRKPVSYGFYITLKDNISTIDAIGYDTTFTQAKDGITWKIERVHGDSRKTLHSGTIRDTAILTDKPCPGLLAERMMKVSMVSIDLARAEQKLMHL